MKKSSCAVLTVIAASLLVTACQGGTSSGKVTAASIMKQVAANTENASSMDARCKTDIEMVYDMSELTDTEDAETLSEEDQEYEISVSMDMDLQIIADPMAMYMDADMIMSYDGEEEEYAYQTYGMASDDSSEMTIYTGMNDEWYSETVDLSDYQDMSEELSMASDLANIEDIGYELESDTDTYNDREVYVLKGSLSGDELQEVTDAASSVSDLLGSDVDTSECTADITYMVYTDDMMPACVSIDMTDMMNTILTDMGAAVTKTTVSYEFISFDEIDEITVPEDVRNSAQSTDEEAETSEEVFQQTTDDKAEMESSSLDDPVEIGEWAGGCVYSLDGTCFELPVRVTKVTFGDEDGTIDAKYKEWYGDEYEGLPDGMVYAAIDYEVYVPEDYPDDTFYGINMYCMKMDGDYVDSPYSYCETMDYSNIEVGPGETATGTAITAVPADDQQAIIELGDSTDHLSFIHIQ